MSISLILLLVTPALAEEIALHGFVQGNYAARITGEELPGPEGGDFILGEERLQLKLAASSQGAGFFLKTDFFRDAIARTTDTDLREAYLDYGTGALDLRIGRQVVTWGVGDLLFINDIFPKDYAAFFSGRPLEYLKIGSDAIKADLFADFISAELVVIPFFEPDNLPTPGRFFLFDPFSDIPRATEEPRAEFENTELALRLYRNLMGFDTAVYAYKGFFRTPGMRLDDLISPAQVTLFFPRLNVYGMSAQGNALGGVVSLETGYDDSLNDRSGHDPVVPNSMVKYLAGYQRQIWTDFTAGFQYYGEYLLDYGSYRDTLPAGFPAQDRLRQLLTARLTQLFHYQTLRLSFFAFYSPTDQDYYFIPEARYSFTDALWGAVGANLFGGEKETTFFGQLDKNDNLYVTMRYEF
ncbi:MAG: hypothetical protein HY204_09875 [Nitrospirae bacterium]|nr:hypothetical protein [Nitrospirota bacterium]